MKRDVHYAANGTNGLAFYCFYRDLKLYLTDVEQIPAVREPGLIRAARIKHNQPRVGRSTDLRRVTCNECWNTIGEMVRSRRGKS